MTDKLVRLQAYLARAGVASRRASEELIRAGKVRVNGKVAEIGMSVDAAADVVEVDGRVITPQRVQWVAVHKPKGYVTTRDDPEGRKTVYDLLPDHLRHLFHVGRLDRDSSGLLLLTNDGEAANRLLHPRYGTTKEYWADVEGEPDLQVMRSLVRGVELEDGVAKAESVTFRDEVKPGIFRVAVVMREGKRREVRRMLEHVGFPVKRLFRRRFGPIEIGRLSPGDWRYLTAEELEALGSSPPPRPARGGPRNPPRGGPGRPTRGGPRRPRRRN
jgi:23S rRNA pseudouridine2605 synthase